VKPNKTANDITNVIIVLLGISEFGAKNGKKKDPNHVRNKPKDIVKAS
jgi:hypothetical protein